MRLRPLDRGGPLTRRAPLRSESAKRRARRPDRAAVRAQVVARGRCEAGAWPHVCAGPMDVHELVRRSQWRAGVFEADNCLLVCRLAHTWITTHPIEAHDLGLSRWGWER